jgi:hypothetical protein
VRAVDLKGSTRAGGKTGFVESNVVLLDSYNCSQIKDLSRGIRSAFNNSKLTRICNEEMEKAPVKILVRFHLASVTALIVLLSGCNGNSITEAGPPASASDRLLSDAHGLPPMLAARSATAAGIQPNTQRNHHASWMSPEVKKKKHSVLFYTSNESKNELDVFQGGKLVGELMDGIDVPAGNCSDSSGNVWSTQNTGRSVVEYAHGGKIAKNNFNTSGFAIGCSVDPTTGDLAVANFSVGTGSQGYNDGDVVIFPKGSNKPQTYTPFNEHYALYPPAYDSKGNLFLEGYNQTTLAKQLLELPKGSSEFTSISLPVSIVYPAGVIVDNGYVDALDQEYQNTYTTGLYELAISGSTAQLVNTYTYSDNCYGNNTDIIQGVIYEKQLVGGNQWCWHSNIYMLEFWKATGGGPVKEDLTKFSTLTEPYGTAVSKK